MFLVFIILGFVIVLSSSYHFHTKFPISIVKENKIHKKLKNGIVIIIASCQIGFSSVFADDFTKTSSSSTSITNQIIVDTKSKDGEEERVKRKLEMQKKSRGNTGNTNDYLDSLAREKMKQQERKKSKSARSQDLCEVLGRGC
jgi:hypothetical protein